MKQLQYEGEDQDDFDALKRHMEQLSQDYALVLEDRIEGLRAASHLGRRTIHCDKSSMLAWRS